jgi:hypothetical protein
MFTEYNYLHFGMATDFKGSAGALPFENKGEMVGIVASSEAYKFMYIEVSGELSGVFIF